jgi:hypothetical protein
MGRETAPWASSRVAVVRVNIRVVQPDYSKPFNTRLRHDLIVPPTLSASHRQVVNLIVGGDQEQSTACSANVSVCLGSHGYGGRCGDDITNARRSNHP